MALEPDRYRDGMAYYRVSTIFDSRQASIRSGPSVYMTTEMFQWFRNRSDIQYFPEYRIDYESGDEYIDFYFTDPSQAALFKLTWL